MDEGERSPGLREAVPHRGPGSHHRVSVALGSIQDSVWGCDQNELKLTPFSRKTNRSSLWANTPSPSHVQKSGCTSAVQSLPLQSLPAFCSGVTGNFFPKIHWEADRNIMLMSIALSQSMKAACTAEIIKHRMEADLHKAEV